MMRAVRMVASLLVAFYLLTAAATVYAECAWVLWSETAWVEKLNPKSAQPFWTLIQADTAEAACESALATKIRQTSRPEKNVKVEVSGNMVSKEYERAMAIVRYVCLPDTVDPRGPKGK